MHFKDLQINDVFIKNGGSTQYTKVPETRVSCCKVTCNARSVQDHSEAVFRPLDEVTKIEK